MLAPFTVNLMNGHPHSLRNIRSLQMALLTESVLHHFLEMQLFADAEIELVTLDVSSNYD